MILNTNRMKILGEFSSDYGRKVYGRGIADKLKMNQKTVSNILNELEKEHIFKFTQEGKNKYYFLNEFYPYVKEIIYLMEIQKKINFFKKYKKLIKLFLDLEERAESVLIVFGSYASFSATEKSDLDIFTLGKIKDVEDLEEFYDIKINIVKSNKTKFNKNGYIIKEIIKNHIVLQGIEDFVKLIW